MFRNIILVSSFIFLTACGGGDSDSDSSANDRNALECVSFSNGLVNNSCGYEIVVRTFAGSQTPVTVPANSSVNDPDAAFGGSFGACRAPYTPVQDADAGTYLCQ